MVVIHNPNYSQDLIPDMRTDVIYGKWILGYTELSFIRFKFLFSPFVIQFFFLQSLSIFLHISPYIFFSLFFPTLFSSSLIPIHFHSRMHAKQRPQTSQAVGQQIHIVAVRKLRILLLTLFMLFPSHLSHKAKFYSLRRPVLCHLWTMEDAFSRVENP